MAELFDMKEIEERVILIAVSTDDEDDTRASLDELEELVKTAGGVTVDKIIQNRERIHPGTYLGKGKIDEVRERIWELQATGVVCDDELSPAQLRNLEDALDTKVMDRTMVILDIFASRATTSEGKIQVELAQLKYRAARLVGLRSSLSRLGGGIGTRGPGEKKLEMDRRLIHERIGQLKSELEEVKRHRDVIRKQREKTHTPVAAIVGYTNAGKSTLLNRLTDAGILAEDKLFATLDPTTRNLELVSTLPESSILIEADGRHLWRVLENVYNNAFKYAMEHTRVYTDLERKDDKVYFTIKNISANPLNVQGEELTERFVRGDVSRTTEGSGLGLSIAQSLTKLQGGTFEILIDGDLFKVRVGFPVKKAEQPA